jgi:lycopene beta-cyclase
MGMRKSEGLLIAGGGLAGCLAALAMVRARPDVPLLLVEESQSFGGNHIWSYFDADIANADRWLVEPLTAQSWPGYYVAFPGHSRKLRQGYNAIRSETLDAHVRETLGPERYRLGTRVIAVREDELLLQDGDKVRAGGTIDARGAANLSMLELGWQKFVGREYRFPEPHGVDLPVLIDATVDQSGGLRFAYNLPLGERDMLVEDIVYSDMPDFDPEATRGRIDAYLAKRRWADGEPLREEGGVLPIVLGGDFDAFWRVGGARVAKIGMRGGFFHPTTGRSLADAVRTAMLLTRQRDFSGGRLHDVFEREAAALWKGRDFHRRFNATLLRAALDERYRIFERLYRQDPALIARFQSGRPTVFDRRRLLGG